MHVASSTPATEENRLPQNLHTNEGICVCCMLQYTYVLSMYYGMFYEFCLAKNIQL